MHLVELTLSEVQLLQKFYSDDFIVLFSASWQERSLLNAKYYFEKLNLLIRSQIHQLFVVNSNGSDDTETYLINELGVNSMPSLIHFSSGSFSIIRLEDLTESKIPPKILPISWSLMKFNLSSLDREKTILSIDKIDFIRQLFSGLLESRLSIGRLFISGDVSSVGKSTISLSILASFIELGISANDIAYIKPVTQCEQDQLVTKYCNVKGIPNRGIGPVVFFKGFTRSFLQGETESTEELLNQVKLSIDEIETKNKTNKYEKRKFVLIDGVGYPSVGSICGISNGNVARSLSAPVLLVGKPGVGDAVDSFNLNATYFGSFGVRVLGAIFNKLPLSGFYSLESCQEAVGMYFRKFKSFQSQEIILSYKKKLQIKENNKNMKKKKKNYHNHKRIKKNDINSQSTHKNEVNESQFETRAHYSLSNINNSKGGGGGRRNLEETRSVNPENNDIFHNVEVGITIHHHPNHDQEGREMEMERVIIIPLNEGEDDDVDDDDDDDDDDVEIEEEEEEEILREGKGSDQRVFGFLPLLSPNDLTAVLSTSEPSVSPPLISLDSPSPNFSSSPPPPPSPSPHHPLPLSSSSSTSSSTSNNNSFSPASLPEFSPLVQSFLTHVDLAALLYDVWWENKLLSFSHYIPPPSIQSLSKTDSLLNTHTSVTTTTTTTTTTATSATPTITTGTIPISLPPSCVSSSVRKNRSPSPSPLHFLSSLSTLFSAFPSSPPSLSSYSAAIPDFQALSSSTPTAPPILQFKKIKSSDSEKIHLPHVAKRSSRPSQVGKRENGVENESKLLKRSRQEIELAAHLAGAKGG